MRKVMVCILFVLIATGTVFAQAESDFQVRQLPDNTIEITRYTGTVLDVVIPSTLYGLRVTRIGYEAFATDHRGSGRPLIRSVVIPNTVNEIGDEAFSNQAFGYHGNLTQVTIGNSVRRIGSSAFHAQRNLTQITIPNSVTEIGAYAFIGCPLTSINLPGNLRSIGRGAFFETRLTSIIIPASVISVGQSAFASSSLTSVSLSAGAAPQAELLQGYRRVFRDNNITRAVLPANISAENMDRWGFEESLRNFYANQNRAAGTYVKNGPIWTRQ